MSEGANVLAALISVNVKPQWLIDDASLLQTIPLDCCAVSPEWSCVLYTRAGGFDGTNRLRGPLPIILQHVFADAACVTESPSLMDLLVWGQDVRQRPLRCAVLVPPFIDFSGFFGDSGEELDSSMILRVFPDMASRRRFLSIVHMLLVRIRGGLQRKYAPAKRQVTELLAL